MSLFANKAKDRATIWLVSRFSFQGVLLAIASKVYRYLLRARRSFNFQIIARKRADIRLSLAR